MKKILVLLAVLICASGFAQVPNMFNYQAQLNPKTGYVLMNKPISLRFTIKASSSSGAVVYQETQTAITDNFGRISTMVGSGTPTSGTMGAINWAANTYFFQIEIDDTGGTTYTNMGTSQLVTVPYAMYAAKSGTIQSFPYAIFKIWAKKYLDSTFKYSIIPSITTDSAKIRKAIRMGDWSK